ncbi:hypothetical protein ACIPZF_16250 [Pseudomonas sp. NPDC089752]|uniref:hypothetical protein n=1 Tax=Pseudomonas sp. NPDC089752 TaxID=3364472 RepID=UPI0038077EFF
MTTLFRISVLVLIAGMLLGDIVLASFGLVAVCGLAVYSNIQEDEQAECQQPPDFLA